MKRFWRAGASLTAVTALVLAAGCEWTSDDTDGFNTSQGAGITANYSGVYDGVLAGGRAVSTSSQGTITRFVINQTGNELDVTDNLGNRYKGRVGSPGVVSDVSDATGGYPAGATVVESQMSWEGNGVEFIGIVHVVTVNDVQGTTSNNTVIDNNTSTSTDTVTDDETVTRTETRNNGTNTVVTTTLTIGSPGDPFYQETVTTVTYDNETGRELDREVTRTGTDTRTSTDTDNTTTTTTSTFTLTEANSQYRLEGTWIESGLTAAVDALSAGGIVVVTTPVAAAP